MIKKIYTNDIKKADPKNKLAKRLSKFGKKYFKDKKTKVTIMDCGECLAVECVGNYWIELYTYFLFIPTKLLVRIHYSTYKGVGLIRRRVDSELEDELIRILKLEDHKEIKINVWK